MQSSEAEAGARLATHRAPIEQHRWVQGAWRLMFEPHTPRTTPPTVLLQRLHLHSGFWINQNRWMSIVTPILAASSGVAARFRCSAPSVPSGCRAIGGTTATVATTGAARAAAATRET